VDALQEQGVALFAISYDPVEVLQTFATKHGIAYPLLSDAGSLTIRRLGMLDEDLERHHAEFGISTRDDQRGVAYPGVFLIDRNGVVVKKRFQRNYRIRDTGTGLLDAVLGVPATERDVEQTVRHGVVQAQLSLDSSVYRPYQQLQLAAVLTIQPGWHVYGMPVPEGYTPLSLEVMPVQGLEVGRVTWPEPHPFRIEGLEDQFFLYEAKVRGTVPLTFAFPPGVGTQTVRAAIRYQACSTTECLRPEEVRFELPVPEIPRVE